MQPKRVPTSLTFIGSTSWIHHEPKGVCLIISPWNFPFNLSFVPLVSAIAAGNCAILKPSEYTPHSSALIKKIVEELFEENEVAVVEGGVETSQALLALPFNHIFFTGSPAVGKIVMAAAAKHLASVTLELGGKSPSIVDETADVKAAARRIAWSKFVNCGQICIAPDYVLVHESRREELFQELKKVVREFYPQHPADSRSYARLVGERHFQRMKNYLEDAVAKGADIVLGGRMDESTSFFEPTVVTNLDHEAPLMQEEIFGPILPVRIFRDMNEAIAFVNAGERPLTMSVFSKNRKNIRRIIQETRVGNTCINHSTLHFYNHDLPFGGVNNSGIGKSHGWYGFESFSNPRAVYRQKFPALIDLLTPPYNKLKEKVMELTIKWF
jgi:aldehyde dehydrogenase (NAD+)